MTTLALSPASTIDEPASSDVGGLTGWVLSLTAELGALGVGALSFLEVVFPPIPSEIVLPLAGYQVQVGVLSLTAVFLLATLARSPVRWCSIGWVRWSAWNARPGSPRRSR